MSAAFSFARIIRQFEDNSKKMWIVAGEGRREFRGVMMAKTESFEEGYGGLRAEAQRDLITMQNLRNIGDTNVSLASLKIEFDGCVYEVVRERDFGELSDVFLYQLRLVSDESELTEGVI